MKITANFLKIHLPINLKVFLKANLNRKAYRFAPLLSIWWSIGAQGLFLMSRDTKIHANRDNFSFGNSNSQFLLGLSYFASSPVVIRCHKHAQIKIDGVVSIFRGTNITICDRGVLTLKNNTYINENSKIHCRESISIGENCAISWGVNILDTDEHRIIRSDVKNNKAPVVIGDHVWIGCRAIILIRSNDW